MPANGRTINVRVPLELENRARQAAPELAGLEGAMLIRAGLAMLAGDDLATAIRAAAAARKKRGPKPKARPAAGHQAAA